MPPSPRPRWAWIGGVVASGLAVATTAVVFHDALFHGRSLRAAQGPTVVVPGPVSAPDRVTLSGAKLDAAGIRIDRVAAVPLPDEVVLPATMETNTDRRVLIRPRVIGVIREVKVILGQTVKAGDVLAVMDSPDVGTARLDLAAKKLDLDLARTEADWAEQIAGNVAELIEAIGKDPEVKALERTFAGRPLGTRRSELLAAYAELEMARHEEDKQADLYRRRIVGEHPALLSLHAREASQAKLQAAQEQVKFDAAQQTRRSDQVVRRAEAAVRDAAQRLRLLGASGESADDDVTAYPIVAPFDGTIVARTAVPSQRVEMLDALFTLADLTTLRLAAHVPESHLSALSEMREGEPLTFTALAYPGESFPAQIVYIGREVDPQTRTVTLLAEGPNADGRLRPGMFAKLAVDNGTKTATLALPDSAVIEIDGKSAVFVPSGEDGSFAVRHIVAGREAAGRRVVLSGLSPGDPVVTSGAFLLKSELILQNDSEED